MLTTLAPAKVNLALHVTGRRADGYHDLESLVVFASHGDRLSVAPSPADRLTIDGPFAAGLPVGRQNIVMRALEKARDVARRHGGVLPPLHVHLQKNLPHASGVGGGSADAAGLFRLLGAAHPTWAVDLRREALALGADVPMCIDGFAAQVSGIGELGTPVTAMPELPMLLVNPGVPVSTPAAFAGLERRENGTLPSLPVQGFHSIDALISFLTDTRNDLEAPALRIAPAIGDAAAALRRAGAAFTRMSGSGATVFGLFRDLASAEEAGREIAEHRPDWWVRVTHSPAAGAFA